MQFAATDYTDLLQANVIQISMSRKENPSGIAACESIKRLEHEEVLR